MYLLNWTNLYFTYEVRNELIKYEDFFEKLKDNYTYLIKFNHNGRLIVRSNKFLMNNNGTFG